MFERICITGGTGSLAQALIPFLLTTTSATILVYSRDEYKQYQMRQRFGDGRLRYFLGDVRDLSRLALALHGVDLCIHAAALKYVDIGEYNPTEVIATNVTGTQNVITACLVNHVRRALFTSSDKAVMPIQTYGASKNMAERLWVRANGYAPRGTHFCVTRWGNVHNSRGSVIPLWRSQLAAGIAPSLTSVAMTRFWLTLPEAVQHVWWAALHAERGSILVPHLPAYHVRDLLAAVTDVAPAVIGVRPGEKLAECLATEGELATATLIRALPEGVPLYYSVPAPAPSWAVEAPPCLGPTALRQAYGGTCAYTSDTWPWRLGVAELKYSWRKRRLGMLLVDGLALDDPARPYVIAEAGGNHEQDYAQAAALVTAAASAGADAVKFQTYMAADLCVDIPILFGYDAAHDAWCERLGVARLGELFARGGLPRDWHAPLKALATDLGLSFLSTAFSLDAARFLVEEIEVPALKIASGDLTFTPLLEYAVSTGLPLIVSTGGATLAECQAAVEGPLADAWIGERLVLLHCCSAYPSSLAMMNLRCLTTLPSLLDVPVGLSDHTLSTTVVPTLAAALGACAVEKHLRVAGDTTSVDAGHALDPDEFAQYVRRLRETPAILGDGLKRPQPGELHDRLWARRGTDGLRPTDEARSGRWE